LSIIPDAESEVGTAASIDMISNCIGAMPFLNLHIGKALKTHVLHPFWA